MASQIRMTPEQMRNRVNEYRNQAEAVNEVIVKMDSLLDALRSEWEGNSSDAYAAKYNELKPGFEKARDLISEIADALDKTANIIEETDRSITFG